VPTYEYLCKDCRHVFDMALSLKAHENQPVACPKCGSSNVEQAFTIFYAVTSKKSA
jgi:putative FmdB family regulatory protein